MYRLELYLYNDDTEGPEFHVKATAEDGMVIIDALTASANLMERHLSTEARD